MLRSIRTALVASASENMQRQLCCALARADVELIGAARDGRCAWEMMMSQRPDLLVAEQELPLSDGASLAERALCSFALPLRPSVLLLHYSRLGPPNRSLLEQAGAVLLEKPLRDEDIVGAMDLLRSAPVHFRAEECARVDALLDDLGVPVHVGRDCLRAAILLCTCDAQRLHHLSAQVYPEVGGMCNLTPKQAERAMRHAIALAWKSDRVDSQYRIFADTIDAGRGQPTCGEMISRLADILRLEG